MAMIHSIESSSGIYSTNGQWFEPAKGEGRPTRICGALNRQGSRCRCKALLRGGKCRFHGGMSTGARTPEGKAKALAAMQAGWAKWIEQRQRVVLG